MKLPEEAPVVVGIAVTAGIGSAIYHGIPWHMGLGVGAGIAALIVVLWMIVYPLITKRDGDSSRRP